MSPRVYIDEVEAPLGLHAAGSRSSLSPVALLPSPASPASPTSPTSPGAVVGGAERFSRVAIDDADDAGDTGSYAEMTPHLAHRTLTPRDVVVLGFLAQGWTTADIAHELAYAESTIKKEVHFIVQRLGARNRTHAVAMAIRHAVI